MVRQEVERAARRVEAREACQRGKPRADGHIDDAEHQEAAENAGYEHPVEHLERSRDAFADQQYANAGEERDDADQVDVRRVGRRRREPAGEQEEDRAGRGGRPRGPADLQEIQHRVEPGPESLARPRAHETGHHRFAGGHGVAHELGVEDGLEKHRDQRHPQQRQAVFDEDGRA